MSSITNCPINHEKFAKWLKNDAEINLKENEDGISPGQACVFYTKDKLGDKVLGGGWITRTVNKYLST